MAESDCLELLPDEMSAMSQALRPEIEKAARIAGEFRG
jgi:hypothetical protein